MIFYILNEFGLDGTPFASVAEDGLVMEFDTPEDAADMAMWMLEGGAESLVDGELPLVTIVAVMPDGSEENIAWVENLHGDASHHLGVASSSRPDSFIGLPARGES